MIPVTYPSSVSTSKESQMVVFALSSVAGLQRWTDYIPVKFQSTGTANSFNTDGYLACDFLSTDTNKQAWVDYIPVYVDSTATDAWQVSATGFIPFNTLPGGGLGSSLDFNFAATGTLDASITFTRASTATFVGSNGLIQSAAIDTPRFDYDPVTLAAKGLLIEESRANLHLYSQDFSTGWAVNNADVTLTGGAATSPDGTTNAGSLLCATTTDIARRLYASANITLATSTVYTASIYVKALNWTWVGVGLAAGTGYTTNVVLSRVNLSTGATTLQLGTSVTATSVGNGWWRIAIVGTTDAVVTGYRLSVTLLDADEGIAASAVGVIGAGVYVFGAQIEAGLFPTSYIPTTTTSLTRSQDVAQVNTLSPWFNATEGTLYAQATVPSAVLANRAITSFTQSSSAIQDIALLISRSADNRRLAVITNLTNQFQYAPAGTVTSAKGALAYKTNDSQAAFDGAASPADTLVTLPTATAVLRIGNDDSGAQHINGHIQRITYYPRRLSQAELESITA